MSVGGETPFGLNDMYVFNATANADIPRAVIMEVTPRLQSGELRGDDAIVDVASRMEGADWHIQEAGVDLDALEIMLGYTVVSTGSTPNQIDTTTITAGACMPWFELGGKALGTDCTDDIHIQLQKCKVTSLGTLKLENGTFMMTDISGIAISDGTSVMKIIQHETAAALPTS